MEQRKRLTVDMLYLGGATVVALLVGSYFMSTSTPPVAQATPTPSASAPPTPHVSSSPSPVQTLEPDNCPACGMAVRTYRDDDFLKRSQQQKPKKT